MNTITTPRDETLELRLKALRLPTVLEHYLELAERATSEGWSHVRYIAEAFPWRRVPGRIGASRGYCTMRSCHAINPSPRLI